MTPAEMVAAALPELAGQALRPFGDGLNNHLFLSDDGWVVRVARSLNDTRWVFESADNLALIRPQVSLPIPVIAHRGECDGRAIVAYRLIPGRSGVVGQPVRLEALQAIGRFLRELHAIDPSTLGGMARGVDWGQRLRKMEGWLQEAPPPELSTEAMRSIFRDARVLFSMYERHPVPSVCLHGDMHADNVLFDDAGAACGVLDFDHMFVGDPAWDFPLLRDWLGTANFAEVLRAYGDESPLFVSRINLLLRLTPIIHLEGTVGPERELALARLRFFYG